MSGRLFLLLLLIALPGRAWALVVATSTTQIADFARQVLGDDGKVVCVLSPGTDPHTYQPTPGDLRKVLEADICIENGMNLEGKSWMRILCRDAGKPVYTATDGIAPLLIEAGGERIRDPHSWFSVKNALVYVQNVLNAVRKHDPARASAHAARADRFNQELRELDGWIRAQVTTIPLERRLLVTSHDAFNYFALDYRFNVHAGFRSLAPVGWSTGKETGAGMTPARRKEVVDSIRGMGAKAVFVETSVNPKLVREIADEAGVRIGGLLFSDSMGEPGSGAETYVGMMRANVTNIVSALR